MDALKNLERMLEKSLDGYARAFGRSSKGRVDVFISPDRSRAVVFYFEDDKHSIRWFQFDEDKWPWGESKLFNDCLDCFWERSKQLLLAYGDYGSSEKVKEKLIHYRCWNFDPRDIEIILRKTGC